MLIHLPHLFLSYTPACPFTHKWRVLGQRESLPFKHFWKLLLAFFFLIFILFFECIEVNQIACWYVKVKNTFILLFEVGQKAFQTWDIYDTQLNIIGV